MTMAQRGVHFESEAPGAAPGVDYLLTVIQASASTFSKEKTQVRLIVTTASLQIWKKSKKKRIASLPLSLVWTEEDVALPKKGKEFDLSSCFALILPSQRWLIMAKSELEKTKVLQHIHDAIKSLLKTSTLPLDRSGSFDFGPQVGVYDGEWLIGAPHGKGKFVSHDGSIFDGDWSSAIAAGYGVIMTGAEAGGVDGAGYGKPAGWETFFPEEPPREAHNDVLDSAEMPSGLTDSDVSMIISHSTTRRYAKGDVILHEGEVNDCLYRIKSGIIRLTQDVNGQTIQRSEMGPDQIFGEMSVLDKNIISATVVAASDLVELHTIDLDVLYELFKTCPGFSKRFHHAMAETLAARLMRFFEPKMSRGLRQTFSGPLGAPTDSKLATTWLEAWNTRGKTAHCYLDLIEYRDPWVPSGIEGKHELQQHLNNLKESGRYWTWEEPVVSATNEGFRIVAKVQLASSRSGAVSRQDAVVEVTMNRKESKFKTIVIRFDKDQLIVGQPVSDVRGGADISDTVAGKPQDVKYCHRFNLQAGETILCEKVCVLVNPAQSSNVSGTLYISQQYLCFYSKVFDMKTKEVVPLKAIKSVKVRASISGLLIKYNVKTARKIARIHADLYHTGYDKNLELLFTFPTEYENITAEISALISKSGASLSKDLKPSSEDVAMDGYRVAKESVIQKFARCSQMHEKIPAIPIRRSMNEQGIRVTGPNATETAESYGTDLCGKTVSTYPKLTRMGPDGKAVPVNNDRQGDPICDQFCIERMENKAIFAVADGCSWGVQPRRAALIASRTFCEFVKHNLSQMTNLQEAGKLFLHAFAAAHHRIIEGFEQSKIWDCGTTTLLGGAILELAPTAQYVERRWGVVLASIGDCKGFLISSRYRTVVDITTGSRTGTASIDASDCGGRLGPHVGEGNPDLRNLSLFYSPADEGDVVIFTSDGVYDNLDPQSFGISPAELGLEGDNWDSLTDWKRIEEVKTAYVCEMLRKMVFGPKEKAEELVVDDALAAPMALPAMPRPVKLDVSEIVEKLIAHAVTTTQTSRDFMENYPDKILPKNYKDYPGKLDHTTCVGLKIKRSTFKSIENELDSLVLRMRNPAQGLSTVKSTALGLLNLKTSSDVGGSAASVVPLTRGEGIESPRYKDLDLTAETATPSATGEGAFYEANRGSLDSSGQNPVFTFTSQSAPTSSPLGLTLPPLALGSAASGFSASTSTLPSSSNNAGGNGSSAPGLFNSQGSSTPAGPPSSASSTGSGSGTGGGKTKPTALRRSNTILNVAIRGGVILRWLRENEKMNEQHAAKIAQMLLGFRYIRPLDVENSKNETFGVENSYNFQVYEPIMTRNDWEQLLKSSKRVAYAKDSLIVKEGDDAKQRLYYIISGKCRTVKSVPDSKEKREKVRKERSPDRRNASAAAAAAAAASTNSSSSSSSSSSTASTSPPADTHSSATLAPAGSATRHAKLMKKTKAHSIEPRHDMTVNYMCENETFGEISFLFGQKATAKASASVVADEDVDLYIIEGAWINILFVKYPGMAGRFYHYLASVLAHRLKKQEILESQRVPGTP